VNPGNYVNVLCINEQKYSGSVLSIDDNWITLQHKRGCVFVINSIHIVSYEVLD